MVSPLPRTTNSSKILQVLATTHLCVSAVNGYQHATNRIHTVNINGTEVAAFYPLSVFETFGSGTQVPSLFSDSYARDSKHDFQDVTAAFLQTKLHINSSNLLYRSGFTSEVGHYAYYAQSHDGVPFANAGAQVGLKKDGMVVSFASSFVNAKHVRPSKPTIDWKDAIPSLEGLLGGTSITQDPKLEYLAREDGSVSLVYVVEIQNLRTAKWYEGFIDAHTAELLSVTDFVSRATYRALPIGQSSLASPQELVVNPEDLVASPLGWHDTGVFSTVNTTGNNIQTFKWLDPGYAYTSATRSSSQNVSLGRSTNLIFDYPADPSLPPTFSTPAQTYPNLDAARVNAFYVLNVMHDLAWRYGFTEDAFNYQSTNLGGRGANAKAADPVRVSVQAEDVGKDNGFFASPADGTPGFCYMLLWDYTTPERDGALANDILVHEFTHGITNRMTGGGTSRCLQSTESNGLGEGWSDVVAEWTEVTQEGVKDYMFGPYVAGNITGLRHYPYSTNITTNPLKYSDIGTMVEPHDIGEVWANVLHNVLSALVTQYGFSSTAMKDPTSTQGNVVFLHLLIDALPLQPCNPTFPQARDAIIQADALRYEGINKCLLWKIFASRGLGVEAADYVDSYRVPEIC